MLVGNIPGEEGLAARTGYDLHMRGYYNYNLFRDDPYNPGMSVGNDGPHALEQAKESLRESNTQQLSTLSVRLFVNDWNKNPGAHAYCRAVWDGLSDYERQRRFECEHVIVDGALPV